MPDVVAYNRQLDTAPAAEPVSTADAKTWLYVLSSETDHDDLIDSLVKTARRYIETEKNTALINQTWKYYLDEFPCNGDAIVFDMYPISAITDVSYIDTNGDTQTWNISGNYSIETHHLKPARLVPGVDKVYPSTQDVPNAVIITVTAGFGAAATNIPEEVVTAIKLLIKLWYDNPEDMNVKGRPWERTAKLLLNNLFPVWL